MAAVLLRTSRRAQSFFSQNPHRSIHTKALWDIDSVKVPEGLERGLACNIRDAVALSDYDVPLTINAYHRDALCPWLKREFRKTGILPIRVWSGEENANSAKMLMDMFFWAMANPPPANFLVISNDARLTYGLQELGAKHYNIFLARDGNVSRRLLSSAKILWRWNSLRVGGPPELSTGAWVLLNALKKKEEKIQ